MNFWATIEHSLQYKYKKNIPDHIREKLSSAADAIIVLDQEMSQVRSEIMDAQNAFQIQANLVADILNTIQNLYQLANKREIAKIQDEFYRIYKAEDLDQLRRFQKQLDVIAEGVSRPSPVNEYKGEYEVKLPEDYIESMRQLLGEEELQNYLDCFDAPRTYGLRVNTGKISVETFLETDTLSSDTGSLGGKWILL